jgi:hypothetical protein
MQLDGWQFTVVTQQRHDFLHPDAPPQGASAAIRTARSECYWRMAVRKPQKSLHRLVEVINGHAVEKGPLCQKVVVLFFGTVDDIRDNCEIEAWMVSPGLDPARIRVPGRATLTRLPSEQALLSSTNDDAYSAAIPSGSGRAKEIIA